MTLTLLAIAIAIICAIVVTWAKRSKNQSELDRHSISVEQLQSMMAAGENVLLFDVRQPLDLLAYPELIPGAKRIPPQEVLEQPSLIPRNEDIVVYCTCPPQVRADRAKKSSNYFLKVPFRSIFTIRDNRK